MKGTKNGKNLSPSERLFIAQRLLLNNTNGVLKNGISEEIASSFGVSTRTVRHIWEAAKHQISEGQPVSFPEVRPRPPSSNIQSLDEEAMRAIPYNKRGTIRRLAKELEVSKSKVGRWVKSGRIKAHTNAIKPALTDSNKMHRLKYSLSYLQQDINNKITFASMHNVIHIDEKWFYMQRASERAYKLAYEVDPYRACKSKRFIPKVMFMCVVARPLYTEEGDVIFDGKIGIFPFTIQEAAIKNSANRSRGTMVTKPIDSINKEVIKSCLWDKADLVTLRASCAVHFYCFFIIWHKKKEIIPAIKEKWPAHVSKQIIIQQDNARPHLSNLDPDFRRVATSDGFDIRLMCQPPNSPDTNVLDLGYFRAIQSLQVETRSYNVDNLVANVLRSFEELEHAKLNKIFLSLQTCMVEIMKVKGGNDYKLPHIGKASLARVENLPTVIEVEEQLVRDTIEFIIANEEATEHYDIEGIMSDLGYI